MNHEVPDVQNGFRKGRGTRDQVANICWITEKAREFQQNICFVDYAKAFDCVDQNKLENSSRDGNIKPPDSCKTCMQVKKQQLNLDSLLKSRDHFATKGLYSQSYDFSSSHVQKWELDHKVGWTPKIDAFELCC